VGRGTEPGSKASATRCPSFTPSFSTPSRGSISRSGGVVTFDTWDLFAIYALVDGGEASRPRSTLPILDGGFAQRQITLGVRHRLEPAPEERYSE